jgi:hypothetical protein
VGTPVLYVPIAGCQETRIEWTRSNAIVVAGKSAVCWITGHYCAMDLSWLKPMPGAARQSLAARLLSSADAFRYILHVNPLMANYRLAVHGVARCGLNPHSPDLPVLSFQVLERELYFGSLMQTERIEQASDVLSGNDALYVIFRLSHNAVLGRQFLRSCEPPQFGRRRRPRWR